jgi:hypothetical protein
MDALACPMSIIWLLRTLDEGISPQAAMEMRPGPNGLATAITVLVVPISSAAIGSDRFMEKAGLYVFVIRL